MTVGGHQSPFPVLTSGLGSALTAPSHGASSSAGPKAATSSDELL